jgi:hypothetical protein
MSGSCRPPSRFLLVNDLGLASDFGATLLINLRAAKMLSPWYIVVRGERNHLSRVRDVCVLSTDHSLEEEEPDEWRLRSATLDATVGHEVAWPALCELLVRLSDVAAAAGYMRLHLEPGALGKSHTDGSADLFVHPPTIRLMAQALPPTIVVNGAVPEPIEVKLLRLQTSNEHLRLALHFLNADPTWVNLWKSFELIRDANGGPQSLTANGWTSQRELERFSRTANTYAAVGDEARHAELARSAPSRPTTLKEADDYMRRLLARWQDSLP